MRIIRLHRWRVKSTGTAPRTSTRFTFLAHSAGATVHKRQHCYSLLQRNTKLRFTVRLCARGIFKRSFSRRTMNCPLPARRIFLQKMHPEAVLRTSGARPRLACKAFVDWRSTRRYPQVQRTRLTHLLQDQSGTVRADGRAHRSPPAVAGCAVPSSSGTGLEINQSRGTVSGEAPTGCSVGKECAAGIILSPGRVLVSGSRN